MENFSGYIEEVFEQLKEINQYYKISDIGLNEYLKIVNKAYVLIAGKENSDKGNFFNNLFLGYRRNILEEKNITGEDITTIIEYGDEDLVEVYREKKRETYALDDYKKADVTVGEYIRVFLNNKKLYEFENLSWIEVPEIEKISEVYNKVSEYTHKEYHYCLIVLPANNIDLNQSSIDRIKEIENKGAVVCFVITKCDKLDDREIDINIEKLKSVFGKNINIVLSGSDDGDNEKIVSLIKDNYKNIRYRNCADYYKYMAERTILHLTKIVNTFEANYSLIDENEKKLSNYLDEVIKVRNNSDLLRECDKCGEEIKKALIEYLNKKEDYFIIYMRCNKNYNELLMFLYADIENIIYNNLSALLKKYMDVLRNIDNIGTEIELAIFEGIIETFNELDLKRKIYDIYVMLFTLFIGPLSALGAVVYPIFKANKEKQILFINMAESISKEIRKKIIDENIIKGAERMIDEKIKSITENINQLENMKVVDDVYKNKKIEEIKNNIKVLEEIIKELS